MFRGVILTCITALLAPLALANEKATLPSDVLYARTVLVVISPDAGEALSDPNANNVARENVEKALIKWGRFELVLETSTADLIIAVRTGSGRSVQPTLKGGPIDNRPVILQPQDGSIRIGGQRGRPPDVAQPTGGSADESPHAQMEIGPKDDTFEVYRGKIEYPLDSPPVWRMVAKNALRSPSVAAVDQFRKAIDETAKAVRNKKKHP